MISNNLGETLRLIRKRQKLTQRELAAKSGIPCQSICNYETGKTMPSVFNYECLMNAMGFGLRIVVLEEGK